MSGFDQRADSQLAGSPLRNEAANYLEAIHGNARVEILVDGKKVDVVCEVKEYGKVTDLFVEVKDYDEHLGRSDVSGIFADYSGILSGARSGKLLVVSRRGLSSAAQAYVDSQPTMFHQTIWELEDDVLGLLPYVEDQARAFESEGLSSYYIPARARLALYDDEHRRSLHVEGGDLFDVVQTWIEADEPWPLAVLGGYGAGKSSFAKRLLADQAAKALADPAARRPILIKLGNITRSTGLDSLLGSLFTSEYEVRGYSFRRFKELNAKGRLLILLDGFDEMKHAMTWTEFRNEIEELNGLNAGQSRVLLLGRPSAFTSDDEHLEVLRGRRRIPGGTRKLHDWPEFHEYELEPFTRTERTDFICRFLRWAEVSRHSRLGSEPDLSTIERRAAEVNSLADQEDEVFGKPVHARILVELALDPDFDLASFATGVTRWSLYAEFFALLARRETNKPARSPIESPSRLAFLRRVAMWLWQHRDGATSFRAEDLPAQILADLPDGDTDTTENKRREYLAGAFLERKAADTFFFPHRSFAEFLVAEELALNPPQSAQHANYDALVRDGVASFLDAAPADQGIARWSRTLDGQSGNLSIDYLLFLIRTGGSPSVMADGLADDSPWKPLFQIVAFPREERDARLRILADTLLHAPSQTIALLFSTMARFPELLVDPRSAPAPHALTDFSAVAAAGLITRIMSAVREDTAMPRHTIDEKAAPILKLAQSAISLEQTEDSRVIHLSWARLGDCAGDMADQQTASVVDRSEDHFDYRSLAIERVPYLQIRQLMPERLSAFYHQMTLKRGTLDTISVVGHTERRGRGRA